MDHHKMTFTNECALRRIERIQLLLRKEPLTIHEIADRIYLSLRWTYAYISHLHHSEKKKIYIQEFRKHQTERGTEFIALYKWGNSPDAIKRKFSNTERQQNRRARIKAEHHYDQGSHQNERPTITAHQ